MYPFFVLDVPHDADDATVEKRYYELVRRYPPDTHPEIFRAISEAYRALRTERGRFEARIFHGGSKGLDELFSIPDAQPASPRRRLTSTELAAVLCDEVRRD